MDLTHIPPAALGPPGTFAQSQSTQNNGLCDRCAQIDFREIFAAQDMRPSSWKIVLDLGEVDPCSPCPMCRLFHDKGRSDPMCRRTIGRLWVILCPAFGFDENLFGGARSRRSAFGITILWTSSREDASKSRNRITRERVARLPCDVIFPNGSSTTFGVPPGTVECTAINQTEVDYGRIQDWLQRCDTRHTGTCCRLPRGGPTEISCIDCYTRAVMLVGADDEYLALSYVWGHSKGLAALRPGKMLPDDEDLSQVVRDAIIVVRRLGKRYLWVDKYCIDQTDEDMKRHQIRHMDRVYEGAYATIVAGAGPDANFGLPGVSSRPRTAQTVVQTPAMTVVGAPRPLGRDLAWGDWIKRGWTYQEAVLSRRLIIFTELQAHFVCSAMTCSETVLAAVDDMHAGQGERPITLLNSDLFHGQANRKVPRKPPGELTLFHQLLDHITVFSGRSLTFQSDALNAFRGILSRWPFYSYYGIPFAVDQPADVSQPLHSAQHQLGFLRALFWSRPVWTRQRKPPGFPSWSWASSSDGVAFHSLKGDVHLPMAKIDVEDIIRNIADDAPAERILAELSPELHLETLIAS
ncbi:heterokaryon incompatibility protein-domain-containing protein [Chaetomium fimeti]|uniref:Heterokaryon incompatibility protein-domain-containing protein n=1 Tax=Chaetomium fimeti TaxID=1854472 RepID=A0AAE0HCH7_9PEZI|nr:heterokaryon incompatibility protein-domain-containing protein [Chaetomium fimeti]